MTPDQILAKSIAAAAKAGSEQVTVSETFARGYAIRATFELAGGRAAITMSLSGAGPAASGAVRFIEIAGTTYMRSTSAAFYSGLASTSDVGRWLEMPAGGAGTAGLGLPTSSQLAAALSLRAPLTEVAGGGGSTVTLRGTIPTNSVTTGNGAGDRATLVISASPPYYPLRLSFSDRANGSQVYAFSDWGARFDISAPKNPIVEGPGSLPGGIPTVDTADVAAQSDLQTALTAAKTYYTENNQSYAGLDPTTFARIDSGLTAVAGTEPSTSQNVISLAASPTDAVMAAWAPKTSRCWAIVDNTVSSTLDGTRGPDTVYIVVPRGTQGGCTAATFVVRSKPPPSVTSLTGFETLGP